MTNPVPSLEILEFFGIFQIFSDFFGFFRIFLDFFGIFWNFQIFSIFQIFWNFRIFWNFLELFGIFGNEVTVTVWSSPTHVANLFPSLLEVPDYKMYSLEFNTS